MSWTRLDDNWTRDRVIRRLDHQTRWHYLCMIQECSAGKIYDGVLSLGDALRCSDASDPQAALGALIAAELVENLDGANVRLVHIKDHVPSSELLEKQAQDRARAVRYRKHKRGDHSDCSPEHCTASRDASRPSSRDARDGDGKGQDGPGQDEVPAPRQSIEDTTSDDRWDEYRAAWPDDAA